MMGADFFHPGYFAIDLDKIPGGNGRSYIWEGAMPVYAQAIGSRCNDFFANGEVMDGNIGWDLTKPPLSTGSLPSYRFNGGNPNDLIVVRKKNSALHYVISGSIQPVTNLVGEIPQKQDVTINLSTVSPLVTIPEIKFQVRRQGSVYIFNYDAITPVNSVFYQLDKWHQYEHPERWSKDFDFEAEMYDNVSAFTTAPIKTEGVNYSTTPIDYTNYTSYVKGATSATNTFEYNFEPRESATYYLFIRARSKNGNYNNPIKVETEVNGFLIPDKLVVLVLRPGIGIN